jgi:hypothetical protein
MKTSWKPRFLEGGAPSPSGSPTGAAGAAPSDSGPIRQLEGRQSDCCIRNGILDQDSISKRLHRLN